MNKAGLFTIAAVVVVGGLTQSAPPLCPLPLRTLPSARPDTAGARPVNADRLAAAARTRPAVALAPDPAEQAETRREPGAKPRP